MLLLLANASEGEAEGGDRGGGDFWRRGGAGAGKIGRRKRVEDDDDGVASFAGVSKAQPK